MGRANPIYPLVALYELIPIEVAHQMMRKNREPAPWVLRYIGYVRDLTPDMAGRLLLEPSDNIATIRARLVVAAKTVGVPLVIRLRPKERVIYFWLGRSLTD